MSVFIQVRQFFTPEGMKLFKSIFEEHRRFVALFPGFISLDYGDSKVCAGCVDLRLEFENEDSLKRWRSSPQHEEIARAYQRHWTREPELILTPKGEA